MVFLCKEVRLVTLSIIDDEGRKRILEASFRVLEETGVQVDHPGIFEKLCGAGCRGDEERSRILFPRGVVKEKLALCPSKVALASRKGDHMIAEPGGPSYFYSGDALNFTRGKETRPITEEDFRDFCRIVDSLPFVQGVVSVNIGEVPPRAKDFVAFRVMLENSSKHLKPNIFSPQGASIIVEMAHAVLEEMGGDFRSCPIITVGHTVCSPLRWIKEGLEAFSRTAGYGIPAQIASECIAGATAPVTLAGTLVLANAQALSGVVINQVLEPGRPCIYNLGFSHVMDMRTAEPTTGAPENGLLGAAGAAFARDLRLPSSAWTCSDSACVDSQSAFERGLVGLVQLLGGANIIWGAGNLESTRAISLEQAVIDNEIFGAAFRIQRGIEVNEENLALDQIHEMASQANYLSSDFTLEHFRKELATFKLVNRHRRSVWEKGGSHSLEEMATQEAEKILKNRKPESLHSKALERVRAIEKRWIERLGG
jgi:trimethylamine---corrinoid protein Co-methyltransferase